VANCNRVAAIPGQIAAGLNVAHPPEVAGADSGNLLQKETYC